MSQPYGWAPQPAPPVPAGMILCPNPQCGYRGVPRYFSIGSVAHQACPNCNLSLGPVPPTMSSGSGCTAGMVKVFLALLALGLIARVAIPESRNSAPPGSVPVRAVVPPEPPDDSNMLAFPDSEGRRGSSIEDTPTALGHLEGSSREGWQRLPNVDGQLRDALFRHCTGTGRGRQCPRWITLLVSRELEVTMGPNDAYAVRVPTLIPRVDGDPLGRDLCRAVRFEAARVTGYSAVEVKVFTWDGSTVVSSSAGGQPCM